MVVTLTGGRVAAISSHRQWTCGSARANRRHPPVTRGKAAEILGVRTKHGWFVDSGLPKGDPAAGRCRRDCFALTRWRCPTEAYVRGAGGGEFRPHVMTTTTRTADYRTSDHIRCTGCRSPPTRRPVDYRRFPDGVGLWEVAKLLHNTDSCASGCKCSRTSSPSTVKSKGGRSRSGLGTGIPPRCAADRCEITG